MKRRWLIFLPLCLLLSGCSWHDAGRLTPVTAGALERTADGYALTAELALPSADSPTPDAKTVTGMGNTLAQAIAGTETGLDSELYWSHARVLLAGQSALTNDFEGLICQLTNAGELRPSVRLCAVTGEADVLTDGASVTGDPVGFALGDSIELAVKRSQAVDMPLYRVLNTVQTDGTDAVLPLVTIQDGQAVLCGTQLFDERAKPCGTLADTQTALLALLLNSGDTAALNTLDARIPLKNIRVSVSAEDEKTPAFAVTIKADAGCGDDEAVKIAAADLQQQSARLIQQLQQSGCDALGLGRAWERKTGTLPDDWRSAAVTVRVTLRGTQQEEGESK